MYRAKRDEGSLCGGPSCFFMISQHGKCALFDGAEITAWEALGKEVDDLLQTCRYGVLGWESQEAQQSFLETFSKPYLELAAKAKGLAFPSLKWLEGTNWRKTKKKNAEPKK